MREKRFLKNKSAISSVLATVIILAITITLAVSVTYWGSGIIAVFTRYEKIEIKNVNVACRGGNYVITVQYVNIGSTSTSIDSILLNGVFPSSYTPAASLEGSFTSLPSACEVGEVKTGSITLPPGATDPSGNELTDGVALTVTLQTTTGRSYPESVVLMGGGSFQDVPSNDTNGTIIGSVGTYGSYGVAANMYYDTDPGTWDAFPTFGPTSSPRNRFNFTYLLAEYGVTYTGSKFNDYLRTIQAENRQVFYRLYWGQNYDDLAGTEAKVQDMMTGVDTSLIAGVVFGDDVHRKDPGVPEFLNSLYDWFKATYPGVAVYQVWAPLENEGPADGRPGFQSSWKADGWVWYSYWANYNRTKAFIQSCKSAQPGKPIMMIVDFSAPWGSGFDPYAYTSQQVRVAREEGCSVCLYSFSETDRKYGWWTSDPLTKQRYAAGEALVGEVNP